MERDFPANKEGITGATGAGRKPERAGQGSLGRDFPKSRGVWSATSTKKREFGARLREFGARLFRKGGSLGRDFAQEGMREGVWGATFKTVFLPRTVLIINGLSASRREPLEGVWSATIAPHYVQRQPFTKLFTAPSFLHPFIPRTKPRMQTNPPLKTGGSAALLVGLCSFVAPPNLGHQSSAFGG